jgi:aquaporin Z
MNKYLIEFLGTMFLVFVVFYTGNAIAIGATLAIIILLSQQIISGGGAFNPVVAISLYSANKLSKYDLGLFIIVEILGALAAFYAYKNLVNNA